jgi:hypothetical protein
MYTSSPRSNDFRADSDKAAVTTSRQESTASRRSLHMVRILSQQLAKLPDSPVCFLDIEAEISQSNSLSTGVP